MQPLGLSGFHIWFYLEYSQSLFNAHSTQYLPIPGVSLPQSVDVSLEGLQVLSLKPCGRMLWCIGHQDATPMDQFGQTLDSGREQACACIGNPHQSVSDAVGCHPLSVLHVQAGHESIGIAIVILVAFGERLSLVGLLLYLVAQIPEHIRDGFSSLQQECVSCQIRGETAHIWPPGLLAQERSADASAEGCPRLVSVGIGVVSISMEHHVCHSIQNILVGHLAQHAQVLIPCEVEAGEGFSRYAWFTIHACGRGCGSDGFVVAVI